MMSALPPSIALLLAAAQPAAGGAPASASAAVPTADAAGADAVMRIFESVCLSNDKAPAGFETAAWSDFPEALRLMNTYDHDGTFFRRSDRTIYIARTRGAGHLMPGVETRCGVAAQALETAGMIEALKKRAQAERTAEVGAATANPSTVIFGRGGAFTVTRAAENWVIVRSMGMMIPADAVSRRYRKRK
jgi:hypothetical protein